MIAILTTLLVVWVERFQSSVTGALCHWRGVRRPLAFALLRAESQGLPRWVSFSAQLLVLFQLVLV